MSTTTNMTTEDVRAVLNMVESEVFRARRKHEGMKTPHEGYAVILEELDELWELVKADNAVGQAARSEALQIAAMAVCYILEVARDE